MKVIKLKMVEIVKKYDKELIERAQDNIKLIINVKSFRMLQGRE
jgi:hypothetical protein